MLKLENITFSYDNETEALKNVTLNIEKGKKTLFLGENGSGKSTLLSMIPAYTFATKGEVSVFDKKFGTCVWAEIKEKVGFVSSSLNTFSDSLNNQTLNNIVLSGKYNSIGIYQEITQKDREKANNIIKDFKNFLVTYLKAFLIIFYLLIYLLTFFNFLLLSSNTVSAALATSLL